MKNKKRGVQIASLFLAIGCCILGVYYIQGQLNATSDQVTESGRHNVALIVKSTTSAFWHSVYAGARAAGTEYNLNLTFEGPDNEEDYETQNELVRQAVKDGVEAIVFSSVDYEANAAAIDEAAEQGVKIVVIDSDVNSDHVSSRIGTDNYEAGRMAGQAALDLVSGELKVGIVNFDINSENGQNRERGFRDAIEGEERVTVACAINVLSTTEDARKGTEDMLAVHPEINVIATFNEWTSLGVGYAIQKLALGAETTVVAFDSNVVSVGMLETGEVDALIVQNPFAMGYQGVAYASDLIMNRAKPEEHVDTATTVVTRENMFRAECQRVLFSFD